MAKMKRVSHSYLDPWIGPRIKQIYPYLPIPKWFPPEGIIAVGHLLAIIGAVGFAYSTEYWWGGLLIAVGALETTLLIASMARTHEPPDSAVTVVSYWIISPIRFRSRIALSVGPFRVPRGPLEWRA